jgi:hypothetical protein
MSIPSSSRQTHSSAIFPPRIRNIVSDGQVTTLPAATAWVSSRLVHSPPRCTTLCERRHSTRSFSIVARPVMSAHVAEDPHLAVAPVHRLLRPAGFHRLGPARLGIGVAGRNACRRAAFSNQMQRGERHAQAIQPPGVPCESSRGSEAKCPRPQSGREGWQAYRCGGCPNRQEGWVFLYAPGV